MLRDSPQGPRASHRCHHESCRHYVYGFPTEAARDAHLRTHARPMPDQPSADPASPAQVSPTTLQVPEPAATGRPRNVQGRAKRSNPDLTGFGFPETRRSSADVDGDPQLPPLKGVRTSHHARLQSIGELQLIRKTDQCLYCWVTKQPVRPPWPCHLGIKLVLLLDLG